MLNAELPLVRMNERNNFRTALINYQRQRRSLMNAEDNLKVQLRTRPASVHQRLHRLRDQQAELRAERPAEGPGVRADRGPARRRGAGVAQSANAATQTTNLLNFQRRPIGSQSALITGYESTRRTG